MANNTKKTETKVEETKVEINEETKNNLKDFQKSGTKKKDVKPLKKVGGLFIV